MCKTSDPFASGCSRVLSFFRKTRSCTCKNMQTAQPYFFSSMMFHVSGSIPVCIVGNIEQFCATPFTSPLPRTDSNFLSVLDLSSNQRLPNIGGDHNCGLGSKVVTLSNTLRYSEGPGSWDNGFLPPEPLISFGPSFASLIINPPGRNQSIQSSECCSTRKRAPTAVRSALDASCHQRAVFSAPSRTSKGAVLRCGRS